MLPRPPPRTRAEPTIALINIVFLMLIFFLIAGTLAPPLDPALHLVSVRDLDGTEPPDALVLSAEGQVRFRGAAVDPAAYLATLPAEARATVRIVPDRAAPAADLVALGSALRGAGAGKVVIVTEQALR
jgi:biopolymer transport protein ExbD